MEKAFTIHWPSHAFHLQEGICKLFNTQLGSDLKISSKSDRRPVKVHSLILQIFCQTLTSAHRQFQFFDTEIKSEDIRCLMEVMYTGKTSVKAERLEFVKKAAQVLGFGVFADLIKEINTKPGDLPGKENQNIVILNYGYSNVMDDSEEEIRNPEPKKQKLDQDISALNDSNSMNNLNEELKVSEPKKQKFDEVSTFNYGTRRKSLRSRNELQVSVPKEKKLVKGNKNSEKSKIENENSLDLEIKDVEPYICSVCDKVYKNEDEFTEHLETHVSPKKVVQCPFCLQQFRNLENHLLVKHQCDRHGRLVEKKFKCEQCDFTCVAKFILKSHKACNHTVPKYKCDQCSYANRAPGQVVLHIQEVHCKEKPFMCETCGRCFPSQRRLSIHCDLHSKPKKACEICGLMVYKTGMSRHKRTHSRNQMFKCSLCKFCTLEKYNLKVHLRNKHKLEEEVVVSMLGNSLVEVAVESG